MSNSDKAQHSLTVIEARKVAVTVSADMLDMAVHLRKLAAEIERGDTVAVSLSWITKECEIGTDNTFDNYGYTLLGVITKAQSKLAIELVQS